MSGPVWEEYREAVAGLGQLPAGLRTRAGAIDGSGAAAVEHARQQAQSARRIAAGWREVADTAERDALQKLQRAGIEVGGRAEVGRPRHRSVAGARHARDEPGAGGSSPTELTRTLRRTAQAMDERLTVLESTRRVERRRRQADRDSAAREQTAREAAAQRAAEAAARAARLRMVLLVAVVVAVVLVLGLFVLL